MDKSLAVLCYLVALAVMVLVFPLGVPAVLVAILCAIPVLYVIKRFSKDDESGAQATFLRRIFLAGLIPRVIVAAVTHSFDLEGFFGGDATTYHMAGYTLIKIWSGDPYADFEFGRRMTAFGGSGWGMSYLVGYLYYIVGENPLATQLLICVLGAATAPLIYVCAKRLFNNERVARTSAVFVAFFPSLILWSSQGIKDGIIVFLLVVVMNAVLKLQEKFDYQSLALLIFAVFGIYSLRFYIFYAIAVAIIGSFVVGINNSTQSLIRRFIVIIVIAIGFSYLGLLQTSGSQAELFDLERLQASRLDQATSAESGYGRDLDVSTPVGALMALPIGFTYLIFAPFPWEVKNFRQSITIPEVLMWWSVLPFFVIGLRYTFKYKLRSAMGILLFTIILTISYSIFQGNVGTAYRQRAQMQVFYFIFAAVGWVVWKERRENERALQRAKLMRNTHSGRMSNAPLPASKINKNLIED